MRKTYHLERLSNLSKATPTIVKYKEFRIPKRKGGFRKIEQPIDGGMEFLQQKLAELEGMEEFKPSYFAHAFMRGRNIVTCAKPHFGNKYIARMDIHDFFGSVTLEKFTKYVDRHFKKYAKPRRKQLIDAITPCFKYDEKTKSFTYLPQGAPTSPFLSNVYLRFIDWKIAWLCAEKQVVYTRYADDMFFSADDLKKVYGAMAAASNYLKRLELEENKEKRKVMKQGQRMDVVGIVLNEKFQIPKRTRKIIRAILHNAEKSGEELTNEQKGLINFKHMVDTYEKPLKDNIEVCQMIHIAYKV